MTRIFGILAALLVSATAFLYMHLHVVSIGPYSQTPYRELRPRLEILQRSYDAMKDKKVSTNAPNDEYVRLESTKSFLRKDIDKLKEEIRLRQINLILALFAVITSFVFLGFFIRRLLGFRGRARRGKKGGFHHSGKVVTLPTRVEYIDGDDLRRKVGAGFTSAEEAEDWLRSDEFLKCSSCQTPVAGDDIGSIQEVVFYEEAGSQVPKDQVQKLASVWTSKPRDRFKCARCGRDLIRSAR